MSHRYTKEEEIFLENNVKGITLKELTKKFNEKFDLNVSESSIMHKKHKLRLFSGVNGSQFKKGCIPHNRRPIGSERIYKSGYVKIKVAENKWVFKHNYIYEQVHGKIPKGYTIIFADKDKSNFNIDNLILVSNQEAILMKTRKRISNEKELTKTNLLITKILCKTNDLKKRSDVK